MTQTIAIVGTMPGIVKTTLTVLGSNLGEALTNEQGQLFLELETVSVDPGTAAIIGEYQASIAVVGTMRGPVELVGDMTMPVETALGLDPSLVAGDRIVLRFTTPGLPTITAATFGIVDIKSGAVLVQEGIGTGIAVAGEVITVTIDGLRTTGLFERKYRYELEVMGAFGVATVAFGELYLRPSHVRAPLIGPTIGFKATWETRNISTGSSASNQIALPLVSGQPYDFSVDWGDGTESVITSYNDPYRTHTYDTPGVYTIECKGQIDGIRFANIGDRLKLLNIQNWGALRFPAYSSVFQGCANMTASATDIFGLIALNIEMIGWFNNCTSLTSIPGIAQLDTGFVTSFVSLFSGCSLFDQSLAGLEVHSLNNATNMLAGTTMSTANYDATLIAWAGNNYNNDVVFNAGSAKYSAGQATVARDILTGTGNWQITDGGPA